MPILHEWRGLLLLGIGLLSQSEHLLDLTILPSEGSRTGAVIGCVRSSVGSTPTVELEVSLLGLDRSEYQLAQSGVFEVMIRNTGRQAITVPWRQKSGNRDLRSAPAETGVLDAIVRLIGDDDRGEAHLIGVRGLQGAQSLGRSLLVLAPGDRGRIRAPFSTLFSATGRSVLPTAAGMRVAVKAEFSLMVQECLWAATVSSTNTVPVTLRR
jgi:hypothetical protein